MIARNVHLRLKPNSVQEFTQTIDKEVIPLLRKQKGFQDDISIIVPGGREAIGISLWDHRADAEAYGRQPYRRVLKALGNVVEGTPEVRTYNVSNSTFHKIQAAVLTEG